MRWQTSDVSDFSQHSFSTTRTIRENAANGVDETTFFNIVKTTRLNDEIVNNE